MERKHYPAWPEEQEDRRSSSRFKLGEVEAIMLSDIFVDPVQLLNVGRLGFSVRSFICYPSGKAVTLKIEGFSQMKGHVVWCARGQVGVRFDEPLDEAVLLNLILGATLQHPARKGKVQDVQLVPVPLPGRRRGQRAAEHQP